MKITASKFYLGFAKLRLFLRKVKARSFWLMVPVMFALLSSGCEALSIALLTPFIKGFLSQDFGFAKGWPMIGSVMALLPESLRYKNGTFFVLLIAVIMTAMVLKSVMTYLSQTSLTHEVRAMNDHLRRALMDRYLTFGKLYFDKTGAGQQLQVLMTHPVRIMQALSSVNGALSAVFLLIVYFISIWMISWQLTLMVAAVMPLVVMSQQGLIARIRASSLTDSARRAELNQKTVNILTAIPFVQSQCAEEREKELYAGLSGRQRQTEFSIDKKRYLATPIQEIVSLLVLLMILGGMFYLIFEHHAGSAAQYMVYFFILKRMMATFGVFNSVRVEIAAVAAPIRDVLEVLDDANKPFVTQGNRRFEGLKTAIEFKGLDFSYDGRRPILTKTCLTLPKGKMTAIVGPSGSGKSTIIQLLLRFYDCPAGTILVDGTDIRAFTLKSLRERMGWVSQETHIFNDTLRTNIVFGLNRKIGDEEIAEALRRSRLHKFVAQLPKGLEAHIGDRGVNLSGGEKQRVSIARAILKQPQILLLDEATSALDTVTESEIQEALADLIAGQTAIVVAHRLSTIRSADRVVYLDNGVVREEGTLQDLLTLKGDFYKAWQAQKFL